MIQPIRILEKITWQLVCAWEIFIYFQNGVSKRRIFGTYRCCLCWISATSTNWKWAGQDRKLGAQQHQQLPCQLLANQHEQSDIFADPENDAVVERDEYKLLINEVRSYRCLLDTRCRLYKGNPKKAAALRAIVCKLRRSGELLFAALYIREYVPTT